MDFVPKLLGVAVLLPLASFFTTFIMGRWMGKKEVAAYLATSAIVGAGVCSFLSLAIWLASHAPHAESHGDAHGEHGSAVAHAGETDAAHKDAAHQDEHKEDHKADDKAEHKTDAKSDEHKSGEHKTDAAHGSAHNAGNHDAGHHDAGGHGAEVKPISYTGTAWVLGKFGRLQLTISYYIDSLTITMFCMVTLIASCIHFYAMGYMHDELHDITDHEVKLATGEHLKRPGRFHRFFQYLSLFCFSMLGLVLAGNVAMVFCFWELVGICSYFLIGFYVERKSASTAANKAFIVNRVGDFGMIIGLMALWSALGTFSFGDIDADADGHVSVAEQGLFSLVRPEGNGHELKVPDGMVVSSAVRAEGEDGETARRILAETKGDLAAARARIDSELPGLKHPGYWLLIVAGVGIFCGCVGKSAQFPLHVWLPDAMEGPTPVSALVHSATMVAAGVYLVGRFFPVFAPEVLIVIAVCGGITLFIAATIAITATDIKRVLAYSTISQLGYMMLALGVGGWIAGLMHLVTHAFFKSLLFMCSGSVIHAVHTNDMRSMGGLLRKMPVTAITMLIGCLAIAGVGIPFVIGFSGYYSKDAILEQAYSFSLHNSSGLAGIFFLLASGGAAITAFYMFRMWYMTFVGKPRDQERYDHAHESPVVMYLPLIVLSVFAISVAWDTSLIGYGLVPLVSLIYDASRRGWFRSSGHEAHGHDDHGHGAHGHDSHSHDSHSHDSHSHDTHGHAAHGHDSQSHDSHGHDSHGHGGSENAPLLPWTWGQLAIVAVATIIGGGLLQQVVPSSGISLSGLLAQSQPAGLQHAEVIGAGQVVGWEWPNEHASHAPSIKIPVTLLATGTWIVGIALATMLYGTGRLNPEDVRKQFNGVYRLLVNKWWFDELYDWLFVRPTHAISNVIAQFDKQWIDWIIDSIAAVTRAFSTFWEGLADRTVVDGIANGLAANAYRIGVSLRALQTGKLRQYVMFIVLGAIAIFVLISFFWGTTLAS